MRRNFREEGAEDRRQMLLSVTAEWLCCLPVHRRRTAELPVVICPSRINDLVRTEEIGWV